MVNMAFMKLLQKSFFWAFSQEKRVPVEGMFVEATHIAYMGEWVGSWGLSPGGQGTVVEGGAMCVQ